MKVKRKRPWHGLEDHGCTDVRRLADEVARVVSTADWKDLFTTYSVLADALEESGDEELAACVRACARYGVTVWVYSPLGVWSIQQSEHPQDTEFSLDPSRFERLTGGVAAQGVYRDYATWREATLEVGRVLREDEERTQ